MQKTPCSDLLLSYKPLKNLTWTQVALGRYANEQTSATILIKQTCRKESITVTKTRTARSLGARLSAPKYRWHGLPSRMIS